MLAKPSVIATDMPASSGAGVCTSATLKQPVTAALVPHALLSWGTLSAITGLADSSLRRRQRSDPAFPKAVYIGGNTRFVAAHVKKWLDGLATEGQ